MVSKIISIQFCDLMMKTERITLRPWLDTDAEALYKYASEPEVGLRAGWPPQK